MIWTNEARQKMSESMQRAIPILREKNLGVQNPMYEKESTRKGIPVSEAQRNKMRLLWQDIIFRTKMLEMCTSKASKETQRQILLKRYQDSEWRSRILVKQKASWTEERKQTYSEMRKGVKNGNWKGGISKGRYPREYYAIRPRILERDDYTCQYCGEELDLMAHHKNHNKNDNREENLITTCRRCNSSFQ